MRSLLKGELLERYDKMMVLDFVEHRRDEMVWCPNCSSSRIVCIEKKGLSHVVSCCSSSCKSFCFNCLYPDHEPAPCSIAKSWFQTKAQFLKQKKNEHVILNLQSSAWIQKNCRKCPKCSVPIFKDSSQEGCIRMKCLTRAGGCGFDFCWWCMKPWHGGPYFGEGGRPGESRPCRFYYTQRPEKKRSSSSTTSTYEGFAADVETFRNKRRQHIAHLNLWVRKYSYQDDMYRVIEIIDRCWNYLIWIRIMIWSVNHHARSPQIMYLRLVLVKLHYRLQDLIRDVESCLMHKASTEESDVLALEHTKNKSRNLSGLMGSVLNRLSEQLAFCDDSKDDDDDDDDDEKLKDENTRTCLSCGESNQNEFCCKFCTSSYDSSIESFVKRSFELESSVVSVLCEERSREEKIRTKISDRTTQRDKAWIPGTCTACMFYSLVLYIIHVSSNAI